MPARQSDPWLRPFTTLMRASEAVWFECAKAWAVGAAPAPEPSWTTEHSIRLDLASMRVRDFSAGPPSGPPTLILAPFALHGATIADFAPGHSIVEKLQETGVSPLLVVECKSATPEMRFFSIDTYLADLNVVVDEVGGAANLVGLCQGGWMSLIYAARFPAKVNGLALVGSPVDLDAVPSRFAEAARSMDLDLLERVVRSGEGLVLGQAAMGFWGVEELDATAIADILQTAPSQAMVECLQNWHQSTVDLPGTYYLQVVQDLFRENKLARNELHALGRSIDLRAIRAPVYLVAGETDVVTPPAQLFGTLRLVGTPQEQVTMVETDCGHLSLFLGARTIAREWRQVGRWIARLSEDASAAQVVGQAA